MKKIICCLLLSISALTGFSQVGNQFPTLNTKNLEEKTVTLPQHTLGKYTLLGLAYSKEAEKDLATWFQPVYETFIHKDKEGVFKTDSYDIHLYFVPMFTGINQAAHGKAVKEMQSSVDKNLWPYLLIYKGQINDFKTPLAMDRKEVPYFFVLDPKGKIIYKTSGAYTDDKMSDIEKLLPTE